MTDCIDHNRKGDAAGYHRKPINGKYYLMHRIVWCDHNSVDISTLSLTHVVRHICDNPRCVNPEHLIIGTQADNVRDMMERGRNVALANEEHGSTVYSNTLCATIRQEYASTKIGVRPLAKKYGLSKSHVHNIVTNANRV